MIGLVTTLLQSIVRYILDTHGIGANYDFILI